MSTAKINKAQRLEGEAVMSAHPFFQSAGRGDLKFWAEDDGPTIVVLESLSELEQEQWSKKMGKSKDWVHYFGKPQFCVHYCILTETLSKKQKTARSAVFLL